MPSHAVVLHRISPRCPRCRAPRRAWTHPTRGTTVETTCQFDRCRLARVIALAGWNIHEPVPLDDRRAARARFPGGHVA